MLADLTTLRLGGPARRTETATTTAELVELVAAADAAGEPVLLVGGGSNLVVADDGWPGTVVLVRSSAVVVGPGTVTADAGVVWDDLVARTVDEGRPGLAATSGIPGSTGATPVQNVGAYGTEVADVITALTVFDRHTRETQTWPHDRCAFRFRSSAFKHTDRYVVLDATFALGTGSQSAPVRYAELARALGIGLGDTADERDVRAAVLDLRRGKGMVLDADDHDTWSVGSFFVNPLVDDADVPAGCPHWPTDGRQKLSAAWLIERAGFGKGFGLPGPVALSTKHTLALTNRGGATTAQLLDLARVIRDGVDDRFGIRLGPEAHLIGTQL